VLIDDVSYYVSQTLAGRYVDVSVDALSQVFVICSYQQPIKQLPIKGLYGCLLRFEDFVAHMEQEARSERRRLLWQRRRWAPAAADPA